MMAAAHISVARSLTGGASSPHYDCANCHADPRPEIVAWRKRQLGHDGPPSHNEAIWRDNIVSGQPLAECPLRTLLKAAESDPLRYNEFVRVRDVDLPHIRAGRMPYGGGYREQPARLMALVQQAERIAALAEQAVAEPEGAA